MGSSPRLIFTGTGRSGTGYVSQLMNEIGIKCGHENVFSPQAVLRRELIDWQDYQADSSWLAVPMLPYKKETDRVVLIVRPMKDVVASLLSLGFATRADQYHAVIQETTPMTFAAQEPLERAVNHWVRWNLSAAIYADEIRWLEHINEDRLGTWADYLDQFPTDSEIENAFQNVDQRHNNKDGEKESVDIDWDSLSSGLVESAQVIEELVFE